MWSSLDHEDACGVPAVLCAAIQRFFSCRLGFLGAARGPQGENWPVYWGPHASRCLLASQVIRSLPSTCARAVPVALRSAVPRCGSGCDLAFVARRVVVPASRSQSSGRRGRPIEGCALGACAGSFGRRRGRLGWGPQEGRRAGAASSTHLQLPGEAAFQTLSCMRGRRSSSSLRRRRVGHPSPIEEGMSRDAHSSSRG